VVEQPVENHPGIQSLLNDALQLAVEEAVEEHGEESIATAGGCLASGWGMVAGLRVAVLLLREIILHEAGALERPALVDLGSSGSVLTGDILDSCRRSIASTAPRAASRPVRDSAIEPVLADASDSTLPKGRQTTSFAP
jgi:hypothetical protein